MRSRWSSGIAGARRRHYTRRIMADRDPNSSYPTPSQMLYRIGAAMLVALCVALAANLLARSFGG